MDRAKKLKIGNGMDEGVQLGPLTTDKRLRPNITGITISPKKNFCIIKIWMSDCSHQNPGVITLDVKGLTAQGCLFKKHTPEY